MPVWYNTLLAVAVVSALPLLGIAALAFDEALIRRAVPWLASFAAGALLGAAFFHLIPDALARHPAPGLVPASVLAGYASFFVLERLLHAHGHTHRTGHGMGNAVAARREALVALNFAGDALHNLIDGMLIAASFLADPSIGIVTTVAVSLHEVPREFGTFGVFVHGGLSPRRAVLYNVLTGGVALAGAAATLAVGAHVASFAAMLLPFAAGNFIYIGASILTPELRRAPSVSAGVRQTAFICLGLASTWLPALME
jgi:zinc and cadmium transporter